MDNIHGDPAECKCECHDDMVYDPQSEMVNYTLISHRVPCCGPALKGSRVETLPEMTTEQVEDLDYFRRNLRRALKIPGEHEPTMNKDD